MIVSFRCGPLEQIEIFSLCFQLKTALTVNVDRELSLCTAAASPQKKLGRGGVAVHRLKTTELGNSLPTWLFKQSVSLTTPYCDR